jgi:hypothetical protein
MRLVTLLVLVLGLTATAYAVTPSTSNVFQQVQKPWGQGNMTGDGTRVQGDTVADPFIIGGLPFTAAGGTCSFNNDYDYACPYTGSVAPDVVYMYVCGTSMPVDLSLCGSLYDTKLYVYQNVVGTPIACNDDYCSWQSQLSNVPFAAGNTYYIVVDGYGTSCGTYDLAVAVNEWEPCIVECPAGAIIEGEPICYEGYNDTYNGGCNTTPYPVFQMFCGECPFVICGTTGVFMFGTLTYRDTDWFQFNLPETSYMCLAGDAEVPCYFYIIDGRYGCNYATIVASDIAGPCAPVSNICYNCAPGVWWMWAGPSAWDLSYECGSVYWLEITGCPIIGYSPTTDTTWGSVKGLFR